MRRIALRFAVAVALLMTPMSQGRASVELTKTGPPPQACRADAVRASFYSDKFEGKLMANGQRFSNSLLTAASRTYPLGSVIDVTSKSTGSTVRLRVTDTGPWNNTYCLDMSKAAFDALGLDEAKGWDWVTITRVE